MLCYNFILQALFQSAQHLYVGSGSVPLPNESGSGEAQKHADLDP
jgi:hypothetical protein